MSAWVWVLIVVAVAVLVDVTRALLWRRKLRELHVRCDRATSAGAFEAAVQPPSIVVDYMSADRATFARELLTFRASDLVCIRRTPSVHLRAGDTLLISLQRAPFDTTAIAFVHAPTSRPDPLDLVTWWERDTRPSGDVQ